MKRVLKNNNDGFTLVEMVVVIVIIAILASIITIAAIAYVDKANQSVCKNNEATIKTELQAKYAQNGGLTSEELDTYMTETMHATKTGDNEYSGVCPAGGTYTVTVNDDGTIDIDCDGHKEAITTVTAQEKLLSDPSAIFANDSIVNYFNTIGKNAKSSLNSTGYYHGSSIKSELKDELNLSDDDFDFRIWKRGDGTYDVYIFDSVANNSSGDTVTATKYTYNETTGQYTNPTSGTAPLVTETKDGHSYLVLQAANWTAN